MDHEAARAVHAARSFLSTATSREFSAHRRSSKVFRHFSSQRQEEDRQREEDGEDKQPSEDEEAVEEADMLKCAPDWKGGPDYHRRPEWYTGDLLTDQALRKQKLSEIDNFFAFELRGQQKPISVLLLPTT